MNDVTHPLTDKTIFSGPLAEVLETVPPEEWEYYKLADSVSDQIAAFMKERGISKAELAVRMGTTRAFVTKVLSGDANMTFKTFAKILHHLGARPHVKIVDHADSIRWFGLVSPARKSSETADWMQRSEHRLDVPPTRAMPDEILAA
jgi:transcriptional regulator with XRE-family HTH domain